MATVKDYYGREIELEAVLPYMDCEIAEALHQSADDEQQFFEAYANAHAERFGEEFAPYYGGAW